MAMTFEQIVLTYYSSYFSERLFNLRDNGDGVEIYNWNVPNVAQPTYDEVMALDTASLEQQFAVNQLIQELAPLIQQFIDSIAIARGYGNALDCLSYLKSSVTSWKNDANAFNLWRDAVWNYIEEQQVLISNGTRPIPLNLPELTSELPIISWPQ